MGRSDGEQGSELEALRYVRGRLQLLNQRKLPHETEYVDIYSCDDAWHAIRDMVVRGAPAIAVTAGLALAVEIVSRKQNFFENAQDAVKYVQERMEYLVSSRPTAVNLAEASKKLQEIAGNAARTGGHAADVLSAYVEAAEAALEADVVANKAIGQYGAEAVLNAVSCLPEEGLRILTHCNTGSLATAAYGTALGVIRALHSQGRIARAYCTETRPYNQGSRLTAYELVHDRIPATLIADSAAASLMASGQVDVVVVGADRIAANGDTANKIGTFTLALSAHQLGIPFFVAAPVTSIDIDIHSGSQIIIEQRSSSELTHANGGEGAPIAASGIEVWNPAFDVTPAQFIAAIITDRGVIKSGETHILDVVGFLSEDERATGKESSGSGSAQVVKGNGVAKMADEESKAQFRTLNESTVAAYVEKVQQLAERLGGSCQDWNVKEIGDGNLNFVYIVVGPLGSLVLKQAVPYVRCVGESWSLSLERAYFEAMTLKEVYRLCPEHVPSVYHFDHPMALIAMQYLEPPHIILRKGIIKGVVYPSLAEHMSDFVVKTLFYSSLLSLDTKKYKAAVARYCGNVEMCRITEQLIFCEPYMVAGNNRWTSPQLDAQVQAIRLDVQLKLEVAKLKAKFCGKSQALLHGDLHSGSVMVTETSTKIIDPEFSFYGPMGFDIGAFIANLFLAFYSQDGHSKMKDDRECYKNWLLQTISSFWNLFEGKLLLEWNQNWITHPGDAYLPEIYNTEDLKRSAQRDYLRDVFEDSLGFAGAKMIRRIVGIAHVEDLESIEDVEKRAACERRALQFAILLIKQRSQLSTIHQVIEAAAAVH